MQTRALSVNVNSSDDFRHSYGIYFDIDEPDRYLLFLDTSDNGVYNVGEELETRRVDQRFQIGQICSGGGESCSSINSLSVTFRRPNFDAVMNGGAVTNASIEIETVTGDEGMRAIDINAAGQITVD
jgi:hypothetical protein